MSCAKDIPDFEHIILKKKKKKDGEMSQEFFIFTVC